MWFINFQNLVRSCQHIGGLWAQVACPDFLTFSADGFQPTRVGRQNMQHLSVSTFGRFLKKPLDLATKNGNWKFNLEQISYSLLYLVWYDFFFYCIRIRNGQSRLLNERQYRPKKLAKKRSKIFEMEIF